MRQFASLEIAVGPVCSGKSTWAMKKYHELCQTKSQAIDYYCFTIEKLAGPKRHSFQARSGVQVEGWYINSLEQIKPERNIVVVDEIQFSTFHFSENIFLEKNVLEYLRADFSKVSMDKEFYFSGLDLDWQDNPFLATMFFMGIADNVHKLTAYCERCDKDASLSEKLTGGEEIFNEGAQYKPICYQCRDQQEKKKKGA